MKRWVGRVKRRRNRADEEEEIGMIRLNKQKVN